MKAKFKREHGYTKAELACETCLLFPMCWKLKKLEGIYDAGFGEYYVIFDCEDAKAKGE